MPGEPPLATGLASWVYDRVWTAYLPEETWPALGPPHATFPSDEPWEGFGVAPTDDPEVIFLLRSSSDRSTQAPVELHSGAFAAGSFSPIPPASEPPDGAVGVGWPEGPGAALFEFPIEHIDGPWAQHLFASDGQRWASVGEGCLPDGNADQELFAADGRIWFTWGDGVDIHWTDILGGEP